MNEDNFSLLWPSEDRTYFKIDDKTLVDLDISYVISANEAIMNETLIEQLCQLPTKIETTIYRQAILKDFIKYDGLLEAFVDTANEFYKMRGVIKFAFERDATVYNVLKRLEDSERVLSSLQMLYTIVADKSVKSEGLIRFRNRLGSILDDDLFNAYSKDLKTIRAMKTVQSIKVGLNLDQDLSPKEAIVLSFECDPFKYTRKLKKLSKLFDFGLNELSKLPRKLFAPETVMPQENLNQLEKIIEPAMRQLINFSDHFNNSLLDLLISLKDELSFYIFGRELQRTFVNGPLNMSQAIFCENTPTSIRNLYNINLAYRLEKENQLDQMITNDFDTHLEGNIFVLTGANRGGKTTFTQAIGQIYWFAQLGLYVPAESVTISMIDGLYVHFPSEESETVLYGRLGEECQRFSNIFDQISSKSLLLMNESFAGTSHLESLTIATESLKAVQLLGSTCIFNTHLHELAAKVPELNEEALPTKFRNLISGSENNPNSFTLSEGEPLGKSYAYDIAVKYGVSYKQLIGKS